MYYLLCWVSPIPATRDHWLEVDEDAVGGNYSLVEGIEPSDEESSYDRPMEEVKAAAKIE